MALYPGRCPGLGASALSGRAASRNFGFSGVEVLYSQKKLDISFLATRFQMIFGEKEQRVKSVTVVTVVTVFRGGVHAFPLLSICKYYIYTYIFIYKYKYISNF